MLLFINLTKLSEIITLPKVGKIELQSQWMEMPPNSKYILMHNVG